jgi:hypothetical protein
MQIQKGQRIRITETATGNSITGMVFDQSDTAFDFLPDDGSDLYTCMVESPDYTIEIIEPAPPKPA